MRRAGRVNLLHVCAVLLILLSVLPFGLTSTQRLGVSVKRPIGDSRVVARLPATPGYPEGIAVRGQRIYVATAARFGTCCLPPPGPPEVQVFDLRSGQLKKRIAIVDKTAGQDHGLSGLAFDAAGRLYVLDTQWGIVRFDPSTAPVTINPATDSSFLYASAFPDLLPCTPLTPAPCSPTLVNAPPLPNDIVFDAAGNAYVTDSLQATIWRVQPNSGAPEVWFQDERLGGGFGVNGIRLDPTRTALYFTVTADSLAQGVVYALPLAAPSDANLEPVHVYTTAEAPDNLAFGESGNLYVALAGSNQISVLGPGGAELTRHSGPARSAMGDVPYDMPSGVAFDHSGALLPCRDAEGRS